MLGAATRPPAAETGRRGWGSAPIFQGPAKGLQKNRQAQLVRPSALRPAGSFASGIQTGNDISLRIKNLCVCVDLQTAHSVMDSSS